VRHIGEDEDPSELGRVLDELGRNGLLSDERLPVRSHAAALDASATPAFAMTCGVSA